LVADSVERSELIRHRIGIAPVSEWTRGHVNPEQDLTIGPDVLAPNGGDQTLSLIVSIAGGA
jgi:hypothetical protein